MTHEVRVLRKADRAIDRLPSTVPNRIEAAIDALADEPYPHGARKLRGTVEEEWRLRVGNYRVVYRIEEPHPEPAGREAFRGLVIVLAVGHRQGIYG